MWSIYFGVLGAISVTVIAVLLYFAWVDSKRVRDV